jgi:hypothetical protein
MVLLKRNLEGFRVHSYVEACTANLQELYLSQSGVCDRRVCLPRDLTPGAGAQWGNLGIAHVGARADRGDAGRRGWRRGSD